MLMFDRKQQKSVLFCKFCKIILQLKNKFFQKVIGLCVVLIISFFLFACDRSLMETSSSREFPCGPVVRTPCFHYREYRFCPWSGS